VLLEGFTFDVERQGWLSLEGETADDGTFAFDFDLPSFIAGTELEGGLGRVYLQATVVDQAQHSEQADLSLPVSQSGLVIEAIPESGRIRAGVENIIYILTSYPDGAPAKTQLHIETPEGLSRRLETGPYGLAEFRWTPSQSYLQMTVTAQGPNGASSSQTFAFEGDYENEAVLLRPDKAVYQVGETMRLDVLTSSPSGAVYLDIVRSGQTMSTRTVKMADGEGVAQVDLTPDLFGTLELHAYKILSWGAIVRDTRLVVVDAPTGLALTIKPDQEAYKPGSTAGVDIAVQGQDGSGVQTALGLSVVDESVFALAEQDPGFAKLYFMLEAELLQPRYDIHGFSVPDLVGETAPEPELETAVQGAAMASMAEVAHAMPGLARSASSYDQKVQAARQQQTAFFKAFSRPALAVTMLLPLIVMGLSVDALRRRRVLGRSLLISVAVIVGLGLLLLLVGLARGLSTGPLETLGYLLEAIFFGGEIVFLLCAASGLVAFLGMAAYAIVRRDGAMGWSQLLFVAYLVIAGLALVAASTSGVSEAWIVAALVAYTLIPLAILLRAAGFAVSRQYAWAVLALLSTFFVLTAWVVPLVLVSGGLGASAPAMMMADGGGVMARQLGPEVGNVLEEAMPLATEAPSAEAPAPAPSAQEPPRLRQYFPETLFWDPSAVTDAAGRLKLQIPMADSITTWRLTALASSQDGRLGAATAGIRVFQDFFIDLDLPVALTQNDEISVPVAVFNYLPEAQSVQLELQQEDWFELLDEPSKEISIEANDISVVYFRIRAVDFGSHALQVTGSGSKMSDAIRKDVTVYPDGKEITFTISDRLAASGVTQKVSIPEEAVPGTQKLAVKIYPGIVSQIVEGLDSMLRMPSGCFEQTSSTTYPNVLVLDYLQATAQASPETQFKAEDYINLGYQRLTTFEVEGGGFSLFGDAPADRMLTAYGLQEFSDMSRVHSVDPAILERAANWLLAQQTSDGSWESDQGLVHESTWQSLQNDRLPVTAYVVWSLIAAGFSDDARTQSGLAYIREHYSQADDPYVVALVANALVANDRENGDISDFTEGVLDQLAGMAKRDGESVYWESGVATFMGSEGQTGSIETTALAAYALLRANLHADTANSALVFLVRQKDSFGTWYSTQATVLSLKALLESVRAGAENVDASVTLSLDGGQVHTLKVTRENFDVVQVVRFDDVRPGAESAVGITVEGEGQLMYQITGSFYVPWDKVAEVAPQPEEAITIRVDYDRTELEVEEVITASVEVALNVEGNAEWALIDLGIPPGFTVMSDDLSALVARYEDTPEDYAFPTVERYELTGRQILVYIANLSYGQSLTFDFRLQAKYPLRAQTPASSAYDYYNPDSRGEAQPISIVVAAP
jgi:uncharacterized protein YfaS (alpha-2-macroglobulin family)